ncbi:type I restriction-modification system specificity subunit S [Secundilactobacillus pentosiphilus]|uniref:Type I restriction-modification system specificity subunit S n=1 Tax=Secundilactobacillus pentosiphilus TaxID=1714682 RepID=A0A1Z5IPK4_9LACO|nr:restriction endonuclease subunit S [Secundilactobacillus pentosiphilus]GAX03699.1 type I restriction-modification system specificity subunit S [Secundilactobacillus pentosiphilus]
MSNKMTPYVRFKGFTDAWEQRKLSSFVTKVKSYSLSRKYESQKETGYRYIHYGDIHTRKVDIIFDENVLPSISSANYVLLKKGDVILADASEDYEDIAAPAVLEVDPKDKIVSGLHTIALRPKKSLDSLFLYYMIKSPKFRKFASKQGQGLKVFGINAEKVLKFNCGVPVLTEQRQISSLLLNIDKNIAHHQKKLENLQQLKKLFLQKIFAQKWRFKGFTDPWEQRKFNWMLDSKDGIRRGPFGSALKKSLFVPKSPYVVYEQQNAIYDRYQTRYYISADTFNSLRKFELRTGDFIMSGAGTIGRISRVPKSIKKGVFNQALIRFRIDSQKLDDEYFLQLIRSPRMQRRLTGQNPGSAITNLVPMSEIKKWEILIPTKSEQQKISSCLLSLDSTITHHQKKLDQLKQLKKWFLQNLFV